MSDLLTAAKLAIEHLDRAMTMRREARLAERLTRLRARLFGDGDLSASDIEEVFEELDAVATELGETGFRSRGAAADVHFGFIAGGNREHFRGGLLRRLRQREHTRSAAVQAGFDIVTSSTTEIAAAKLHLVRAAVSLEDSGERRQELLAAVRAAVLDAIADDAWKEAGRSPALTEEGFERNFSFSSTVSAARVELPRELAGSGALMPNRPFDGWEERNAAAVRTLLDDLSGAGSLFIDRLGAGGPRTVAMKIDLNMGIDGPPTVSDPVVTGAVLYELLERGFARGVPLHFTVGDSCGVENAPVGRTSLDIMRETGNYHYALKAALRFVVRRDETESLRAAASEALERLARLESSGVFFGSPVDRESGPREFERVEALAAPWVRCVDYDDTGFIPVRTELSAAAAAVWGTRDFHLARPWVEADHRVHVTRGCSTHLFAGWTGGVKGLVGLHALGMRPADQGMNERGESPLDLLAPMMWMSGYHGVIARRGGFGTVAGADFSESTSAWERLRSDAATARAWHHWHTKTATLETRLRGQLAAGTSEVEIMARMRRETRDILIEADALAPGFRAALWHAVAVGTRSGLLTAWRFRSLLPENMRDERMGTRIGILTHVPMQAELVVQGLPKIGIGGGPDAYERVDDVGVIVAGTDQASVDLTALRLAGVPGNPWAYNYPVYGAVQFGRGPALWEEIRVIHEGAISRASSQA